MRLESAGIEAFVQDENMVQMDMLYSNAIGGVRVQIADGDIPEARDFLAADAGIPSDAEAPRCPKCGGTAIETERISTPIAYVSILLLGLLIVGEASSTFWLAYLSILLFGLPLLLNRRRSRCTSSLPSWRS